MRTGALSPCVGAWCKVNVSPAKSAEEKGLSSSLLKSETKREKTQQESLLVEPQGNVGRRQLRRRRQEGRPAWERCQRRAGPLFICSQTWFPMGWYSCLQMPVLPFTNGETEAQRVLRVTRQLGPRAASSSWLPTAFSSSKPPTGKGLWRSADLAASSRLAGDPGQGGHSLDFSKLNTKQLALNMLPGRRRTHRLKVQTPVHAVADTVHRALASPSSKPAFMLT